MEESRPVPEFDDDQDDQEDEEPKSKRRSFRDFLTGLFERGPDEAEKGERPRFMGRLLRLFGVSTPNPETAAAADQTGAIGNERVDTATTKPEAITTPVETAETPPRAGRTTDRARPEAPTTPETPVEPPESTAEAPPTVPERTPPAEARTATRSEHTIFERRTDRPERVVEHHDSKLAAAATLLVGVEYLGRRRADRKLKREITKLQKRVHEGQQATRRLEQLAPKASEERALVQAQQRAFEARPLSRPAKVEARTPTTEPVPEKTLEKLVAKSRPEQVLEKVAAAAERNVPLERLYERRHEVKDQSTPVPVGASSVGTILSQLKRPDGVSQDLSTIAQEAAALERARQKLLYTQAAKSGFWGAIVVLVFFIIGWWLLG